MGFIYKFFILTILSLAISYSTQAQSDEDEEFEAFQETKIKQTGIKSSQRKKFISNGNEGNKVIVEPKNIIPVTSSGKMEMVPYRMRRKKWGTVFGVSFGNYVPEDFQDQTPISFTEFYPAPTVGLISIEGEFKRNFDYLTLGGEVSIGYFKTTSDVENFDSELTIVPLKLGIVAKLETLWSEPWVVPYISGGIYSAYYNETTNGSTVEGTTLVSFYASGGLMFQIDWLDEMAARDGYQNSGIENTFIFLEGNFMSDSIEEKDPALNSIYASAGLRVEF